jgi:hypothetical protein
VRKIQGTASLYKTNQFENKKDNKRKRQGTEQSQDKATSAQEERLLLNRRCPKTGIYSCRPHTQPRTRAAGRPRAWFGFAVLWCVLVAFNAVSSALMCLFLGPRCPPLPSPHLLPCCGELLPPPPPHPPPRSTTATRHPLRCWPPLCLLYVAL